MEQSQTSMVRERGRLETQALPSDKARFHLFRPIWKSLVLHLELEQVLATLQRFFQYDWCAVIGRSESGELRTWACRPRGTAAPFSRTLARRILERGEALLYDDIQSQAPFDLGERVVRLNVRVQFPPPRGKAP